MSETAQPFSVAPGQGRLLPTPSAGRVTFKVRSDESSGRVSVLEFEVPAGGHASTSTSKPTSASTSSTATFGSK